MERIGKAFVLFVCLAAVALPAQAKRRGTLENPRLATTQFEYRLDDVQMAPADAHQRILSKGEKDCVVLAEAMSGYCILEAVNFNLNQIEDPVSHSRRSVLVGTVSMSIMTSP